MEESRLDGLAASGEAVGWRGWGRWRTGWRGRLAVKAGEGGDAGRWMEGLVWERGLELLCGVVQLGLKLQADGESGLPGGDRGGRGAAARARRSSPRRGGGTGHPERKV